MECIVVVLTGLVGSEEDEDDVKVDAIANVKELDEVLMKDVGNKIAQSGKLVFAFEMAMTIACMCTVIRLFRLVSFRAKIFV